MLSDYETEAEKRAYATGRADAARNYQTTLTAALGQVKADAWDRGYRDGWADCVQANESNVEVTTPNPYRQEPGATT